MPAPRENVNARKGEVNRQMWSQRLPVDVIETIKDRAKALEISQADYVVALVRQPNKAIAAELLPWLLSEWESKKEGKIYQDGQENSSTYGIMNLKGENQ